MRKQTEELARIINYIRLNYSANDCRACHYDDCKSEKVDCTDARIANAILSRYRVREIFKGNENEDYDSEYRG